MNKLSKISTVIFLPVIIILLFFTIYAQQALPYRIVDTGQSKCYDNIKEISAPKPGFPFYGQDAQFIGYQPSYTDNGDGTITDNITGLMWQKSADMDGDGDIDYNDKMSYKEALTYAKEFRLGGYDDWRLPTIKELYSLIMFYGIDPSGFEQADLSRLKPFIDTSYFDFAYGDVVAGERLIDAQYVSATKYVGTTMNGNETVFGVNFADGRIKGYPVGRISGRKKSKRFYVKYVRGNPDYGKNKFVDNGDGTITDLATGLMWTKYDSKIGMNWKEALVWVQQKNVENYLGYNDWRLPNIKELQSIVDYTRSPATSNSAAIDPIFDCSVIIDEGGKKNYPFYWSSTTHANMINGRNAAYVAFGEGLGWMKIPPYSGNYNLLDVHGAGCQRSDPKVGDPANYPYGRGPQGDVIRINNYVRLVRDANVAMGVGKNENSEP